MRILLGGLICGFTGAFLALAREKIARFDGQGASERLFGLGELLGGEQHLAHDDMRARFETGRRVLRGSDGLGGGDMRG